MTSGSDLAVVAGLAASLGLPEVVADGGVDQLLPLIEHLRRQGLVVLLKWDGGRNDQVNGGTCTGLVSGLAEEGFFFRADLPSIEATAVAVLAKYGRWLAQHPTAP